jgi:malonyl-CoA decarboxylase
VTLSPVAGFSAWLGPGREHLSRTALTAAAAEYLLTAADASGRPADPVARFHLGNGARLERINWMGDPSPHGLETAAGFMVNYLYDLSRAERNHELFENRGERVASHAVRRLLRRPRQARLAASITKR